MRDTSTRTCMRSGMRSSGSLFCLLELFAQKASHTMSHTSGFCLFLSDGEIV